MKHGERLVEMYHSFKEAVDALWFPVTVSLFGYVAKSIYGGIKNFKKFLAALPVVAFSGVIAHWFLSGSGVNPEISAAIIGVSGWGGGMLMEVAFERITRAVSGEDKKPSGN